MSARSFRSISVVKPGTGLCCQIPPSSSKRLPSSLAAAASTGARLLVVLHSGVRHPRGRNRHAMAERSIGPQEAVDGKLKLELAARLPEIARLVEAFEAFAERLRFPPDAVHQITLVL